LLRYLLENADRLVTKEELIRAIWPDVVVNDESLTRCVSEVRQAIDDGDQAIIKTTPRRGYRFTAPVVRVATGRGGAASPLGPRRPPPPPLPSPTCREGYEGDSGPRLQWPLLDRPSVAVLPFANLSGDPQQTISAMALPRTLQPTVPLLRALVIARNSSFKCKGRAVDIPQIGQELGARYVLEGSVRRSGDRIRITAQLIDAMTAPRWAERYDREQRDTFAVQDEVARAIVANPRGSCETRRG